MTWGDAVLFDACVECCVELACPDDGDAVTEGSVILSTVNKESLELLPDEGEGFAFLASSSSCSRSLSVSAAVLSASERFCFSTASLSLEMLASVLLTAGEFFSKRNEDVTSVFQTIWP